MLFTVQFLSIYQFQSFMLNVLFQDVLNNTPFRLYKYVYKLSIHC